MYLQFLGKSEYTQEEIDEVCEEWAVYMLNIITSDSWSPLHLWDLPVTDLWSGQRDSVALPVTYLWSGLGSEVWGGR